ncbi:hypothetical protein SK069_10735 [Patulibacter brassicae]|uniref:Uncharacterized protein n=1 Tax=Patulibacter brassicae TaxID=1705717 RepID=A0ABU4VM98_9ACTN|nr:hypothetical protein [Patulibacter brassicae]MDX8152071.1 hypothetical protein [Patulibacter brassicae]
MKFNALLDVDCVAVESDDEVSVLLEIEAPKHPDDAGRPPRTLIVVLDRSGAGSCSGRSWFER